jgi:hypothetical protein
LHLKVSKEISKLTKSTDFLRGKAAFRASSAALISRSRISLRRAWTLSSSSCVYFLEPAFRSSCQLTSCWIWCSVSPSACHISQCRKGPGKSTHQHASPGGLAAANAGLLAGAHGGELAADTLGDGAGAIEALELGSEGSEHHVERARSLAGRRRRLRRARRSLRRIGRRSGLLRGRAEGIPRHDSAGVECSGDGEERR